MKISIIAAVSMNGVIGNENTIPWKIPSDLKNFRKITSGSPVVMGRKTFESIGRPLPKRKNIVLTSNKEWSHEGVEVAHSINDALSLLDPEKENFIIGGTGVYSEFLGRAQKYYISHILADIEGDAYFPQFDFDLMLCSEQRRVQEDGDEHPYIFKVYEH